MLKTLKAILKRDKEKFSVPKKVQELVFKRVDPFDKTSTLCQRHNKKGYMYFIYPKNLMER